MLYIDPEACTDCNACAAECPVEAIFQDDDVPEPWKEYIALNAEMVSQCPPILQQKAPIADCWDNS